MDEEHQGQRIDNYLFARLKGVPKSHVYRIIRKGEVRVNKGRIKAVYKLKAKDLIRIPPIRVSQKPNHQDISKFDKVQELEDSILYETKQFLAVNKPSGIAVHGGSGQSFGVIEALRALRPKEKFLELVHRIDRDTSGCLLIAKRRSYLVHFQNQLRHRKMNKEYLAVLSGTLPKGKKLVDQPLYKKKLPSGEHMVVIDDKGKPSQTRFTLLEDFGAFCLVKAKPLTGRTHQIRVHAKYLSCPLLGDEKYSDIKKDAQLISQHGIKTFMLHAHKLTFTIPDTEQSLTLEAPMPKNMRRMVN